jgi:hypothetical protein
METEQSTQLGKSMASIKIEETSIKLSASFALGAAPLSYDQDDGFAKASTRVHYDVGRQPRRIDFDVASDLLSEMLLGVAGEALPADLMLRGVDEVYINPMSNWRDDVLVSIQASVGDAGEIYGPCWKSLIAEKMKGVITRFIAMTQTPGALKWWERRTELERRLKAHDNAHRGYMASDEFYTQQAEIREHPDFDNTEPPDFIGDVLLATKFAELDIAITGKQVQGWKEYPLRFEDIVGSHDLIYLNDGGYSRMGLFINTDDTIRIVICMNEKSDHHGRQHDDDVTAKMREIQEAATTWYRASLKEAGVDASCR